MTMLMILAPVDSQEKAAKQLDDFTRLDPEVVLQSTKAVSVCGVSGTRIVGSNDKRGLQFDYLNVVYRSGNTTFPIQVRNQMNLADVPLFSVDVDKILGGFQVS